LDHGHHHDITVPEIAEYVLLWELVAEAGFNNQDKQEDEILWTRTPDSSYSAKSAYEMQFDDSIGSPFPLNVWKVCAPSKCKFFIWLLLQNRVWTADRLQQRGWPNQYFCIFCHRNLETAAHIFMECPITRQVWLAVGLGRWASLPRFAMSRWAPQRNVEDRFYALAGRVSSVKARGSKSLIILVSWTIWCERNARISNAKEKSIPRLITDIKDEATLWHSAGAKNLGLIVAAQSSE
jgi:hypothetical protein